MNVKPQFVYFGRTEKLEIGIADHIKKQLLLKKALAFILHLFSMFTSHIHWGAVQLLKCGDSVEQGSTNKRQRQDMFNAEYTLALEAWEFCNREFLKYFSQNTFTWVAEQVNYITCHLKTDTSDNVACPSSCYDSRFQSLKRAWNHRL